MLLARAAWADTVAPVVLVVMQLVPIAERPAVLVAWAAQAARAVKAELSLLLLHRPSPSVQLRQVLLATPVLLAALVGLAPQAL